MRKLIRYIAGKTWKPWLEKKLSRPVVFSYHGIHMVIPPGVFHPGYFHSTKFLLHYLLKTNLDKKKLLELGCGSGLIAIAAAKRGAIVTATDISITAVCALELNAKKNSAELTILHSDAFHKIPVQHFDLIAINPPYYKGSPKSEKDLAWYCGEGHEYFTALFSGLGNYVNANSVVLMVLSDECDLAAIRAIGSSSGFALELVQEKSFLLNKEMIFRISPA